MSGHSKWASIKHKKAATDAKRGKIFTRLIREISLAARAGGGDPDKNARLRKAINVAIFLQAVTDNKNRTVSEIRHIFQKNGGTLSEKGSVAWMFKRMGYIDVEKAKASEDILMDVALSAGAEDLKDEESLFEVTTTPEAYEAVLEAVKKAEIEVAASEVGFLPQNYVKVTGKEAQQVLRLVEELEDHDDVQSVSSNFDISEEEIAAFSQAG